MVCGDVLVGVDVGTFGTKAVVVDLEGRILGDSFKETDIISPKPLWAEQWPQVWFRALCDAVKVAVSRAGVDPSDVVGLCVSGLYSGSGIPCDRRMEPIRPCIIWMDRRAVREVEWVRRNIGEETIFKVTGNTIDTYFGFTKMLWIKFNEPKTWERTYQLLTTYGYCIYRLTGTVCIDYSSAGNYGGIFNIHKRDWAEDLMEEMGIPRSFFPEEIVESKTIVGEITDEGSKLCGLKKGTPVAAGGVDAPVAALSLGCLEEGDHAAMIGTSTCWSVIQDKPRLTPKLISYPHVAYDREKLYTFGGSATSGGIIRWFRKQFGQIENILGGQLGLSAYKILDLEAEKIPPGSDGLIVLPYFMGERTPIWDPYAKGLIIGLTLSHTKAHIFRALMEGAAYALRHNIETAKACGIPLKPRMGIVDGGAKSPLWRRIFANVTGFPLVYVAESPGTPLGDALLAGVGTKVLGGYEVIRDWVKAAEVQEPDPKISKVYERYYRLYLRLYEMNREIYRRLYEVVEG